jgi:hypothetical protein
VLFAKEVNFTATYEETILGGIIVPRFERGVDGLQSEFGKHSAGDHERAHGHE